MNVSVASRTLPPLTSTADIWAYVLEPLREHLKGVLAHLDQPTAYVLIGRSTLNRDALVANPGERSPSNPHLPTFKLTDPDGRWINTDLPTPAEFSASTQQGAALKISNIVAERRTSWSDNFGFGEAIINEGQGLSVPGIDSWVIVVQGTTICNMIAAIIERLIRGYAAEREMRIAYAAAQAGPG
ncbi:MAG: hypothetical protein RJB39_187 [Candidatus Parcubacteria bacterium]|jgi:hypothetical protein